MPKKAGNLIAYMAQRGIPPAKLARWLGVKVGDLRDDLELTPERVEKLKTSCIQGWK